MASRSVGKWREETYPSCIGEYAKSAHLSDGMTPQASGEAGRIGWMGLR